MVQCPTCGAQVEEDTDICPECGTDLSAIESAAPSQAAPSQQAAPETAQQQAERISPGAEVPTPVPVQVITAVAPATLTLIRAGAPTSEVFNLGERVAVGRFDAETGPVDVDLGPLPESMYISRQHAEIFKSPEGKWMVRDLGSSNGTFVRNRETQKYERIEGEQEITDGDELAFGNARFIFKAG